MFVIEGDRDSGDPETGSQYDQIKDKQFVWVRYSHGQVRNETDFV